LRSRGKRRRHCPINHSQEKGRRRRRRRRRRGRNEEGRDGEGAKGANQNPYTFPFRIIEESQFLCPFSRYTRYPLPLCAVRATKLYVYATYIPQHACYSMQWGKK